jgi:hypothetical protein
VLAATLDLEGIDASLLPGFNSYEAMVDRIAGLERYWDARTNPPAYASAVVPRYRRGGDKYYDDNAWVGLALVQHDRLRGVASSRERAETLFQYFAQPEQFNAIFFRNLLLLHEASGDATLKESIMEAITGYADEAWEERREPDGLFPKATGGPTLVKHAGMIQIFALLAWDPVHYRSLA